MKKDNSVLRTIVVVILATLSFVAFSRFAVMWDGFRGKNLRVPFDGDSSRSHIVDDRDILSKKTEDSLNKLVREYSDKLQMNIFIFVSGTKHSDSDTDSFAANTYNKLAGEDYTDGCIYYMDFSGKKPAYDYMWVSGKAGIIFPSDISEVTDKVVPYLPPSSKQNITEEDVVPGIKKYLEIISDYVDDYSQSDLRYETDPVNDLYFYDTGSDYYCTKNKAPGARFVVFMYSYAIGLIMSLILYFIIKSKYKFKDKTSPGIYVANGRTNFTVKTDTFIREYTTKTKIESSSGGGHGGGGGHSGGGRGGGSHR